MLNIKTVITVRSQLAEFETSGRFCLFVIGSLEKFVSGGRTEMIDLLEIEFEIANISNYQGSALSGACVPWKTCVWAEKMCRNRAQSSGFRERVGA